MYTDERELRSATRCLQPVKSKKTRTETLSFIGCDFTDNQKWEFRTVHLPGTKEDQKPGMLVHVATGRCLSMPNKSQKRKSEKSVLSFLASIALESGFNSGSPTLENCKANNANDENQTQLWLMNIPAQWRH